MILDATGPDGMPIPPTTDPPSPAIGVICGFDEVVRALKAGYGARRAGNEWWVSTRDGKLTWQCVDAEMNHEATFEPEDILAEDWTICGPNGEP